MRNLLLISMVALAVAGCPVVEQPCLLAIGRPTFVVNVTDERGDPVFCSLVTITTDDFSEEGISDSSGVFRTFGAGASGSVYTITVKADGFESITIDDVVLERAVVNGVSCSPQVRLDVSLIEPMPRPKRFVYGVTVSLADENGKAVSDATVRLVEDEYSETMEQILPGVFVGAGERAGIYLLTVEADGFGPVTIRRITVEQDVCHVFPVTRTITLIAE